MQKNGDFYTVPGNPADGFESDAMRGKNMIGGKWWEVGGGGTAWDSMAYDPELNLLYIGTGMARLGTVTFAAQAAATSLFIVHRGIEPDTGEYVWHYQTTPGDTGTTRRPNT